MPICPSCGSTNLGDAACLDCGARTDLEARIASWIEPAPEASARVSGVAESACGACGYSGEMLSEPWGSTCPACGVTVDDRRADESTRLSGVLECPECGRKIGVTGKDEGRTVLCPGCSYFLGTFKGGAEGSKTSGRLPRGR